MSSQSCFLLPAVPSPPGGSGEGAVSNCSLAYSPAGLATPTWFLLLGKGWGGGVGDTVEAPPGPGGLPFGQVQTHGDPQEE